jgi:hypothetical protein
LTDLQTPDSSSRSSSSSSRTADSDDAKNSHQEEGDYDYDYSSSSGSSGLLMTDCMWVPRNTRGLRLAPTQQQQQQWVVEACYTAVGVLEQCLPKAMASNASGAAAAGLYCFVGFVVGSLQWGFERQLFKQARASSWAAVAAAPDASGAAAAGGAGSCAAAAAAAALAVLLQLRSLLLCVQLFLQPKVSVQLQIGCKDCMEQSAAAGLLCAYSVFDINNSARLQFCYADASWAHKIVRTLLLLVLLLLLLLLLQARLVCRQQSTAPPAAAAATVLTQLLQQHTSHGQAGRHTSSSAWQQLQHHHQKNLAAAAAATVSSLLLLVWLLV